MRSIAKGLRSIRCICKPCRTRKAGRRWCPYAILSRIVDSAVAETQETFAALRIPTDTLRLERQAERARQILESILPFIAAVLKERDEATQKAGQRLHQRDFELTPLIGALLEALQAAGFDRAVFGLVNVHHTFIRGRLGR